MQWQGKQEEVDTLRDERLDKVETRANWRKLMLILTPAPRP